MHKYTFFFLSISLLFFSCKKDTEKINPTELLYAKKGTDAGIYDQDGRFIILRGVNYNVLGDYWQANPAVATQKQYEENDLKLMSKYGINCIRLLFSWSKLEPQKGNYNQAYIQEIKDVIETAAKYDIYVMLDMHQDAYGKYIASPVSEACDKPNKGWDGAPDWATITDGASTCTTDGSRESAPAVVQAFENFWNNKNGMQDACINAWSTLVKQTAGYANVVGYDLINEPGLGNESLAEESDKLTLFYKKTISSIRDAENQSNSFHHIIFFEISVTWNGQPFPFVTAADFTTDDNIVFGAHSYFEAISYAYTIEGGYDFLYDIANYYKSAMFMGEYGFFDNPVTDAAKMKRFAKKEDEYFTGSTFWQWSQAPGDPHGISWDGTQYSNTSLHLIELNKDGIYTGNNNEYFLNVLSRTRPNAICGKPIKLISNPDDGTMELQANTTKEGITVLWIPNRFSTPIITGTNIISSELKTVDGGYLASVKVNGNYKIVVGF